MIQIRIILICLIVSFKSFSQDSSTKQLDSVFSMMQAQNQFNGSVLIAEGGKVIFSKGYGYRDLASKYKNNEETIYELASCSKQFTAAAIVLLRRKGMLQYEDSLQKYIPELSWQGVTIYDLLRHTSGIPEYIVTMPDSWDHKKIATNNDLDLTYLEVKILPSDILEAGTVMQHLFFIIFARIEPSLRYRTLKWEHSHLRPFTKYWTRSL